MRAHDEGVRGFTVFSCAECTRQVHAGGGALAKLMGANQIFDVEVEPLRLVYWTEVGDQNPFLALRGPRKSLKKHGKRPVG